MNREDKLYSMLTVNMCKGAIKKLKEINEVVPSMLTAIENFKNETGLTGEAMENCKMQMDNYTYLLNFYMQINNKDISDYRTLENAVDGQGDFLGDEILDSIDEAKKDKEYHTQQAEEYEREAAECFILNPYRWLLEAMARWHRNKAEAARKLQEYWEKRRDTFDEININTAKLFKDSINNRKTIESTLKEIASVYDAETGMFASTYTLEWRRNLQTMVGVDVDPEKVNPDWYGNCMQLDGDTPQEEYLNQKLSNLKKVPWNQEKVNELWSACEMIYDEYGIEIDPRILLAIIIQEGTGSFNTSSTNLAADGQNGVETDYAKDLMKANKLIFGKIIGYMYYHDEFEAAVAGSASLTSDGDGGVFDYMNWKTPVVNLDSGKVYSGVYAGHSAWGDSVEKLYENLSYEGAAQDYSDYVSGVEKEEIQALIGDINMPDYTFEAQQIGQNSRGVEDGSWIIVAK